MGLFIFKCIYGKELRLRYGQFKVNTSTVQNSLKNQVKRKTGIKNKLLIITRAIRGSDYSPAPALSELSSFHSS